MSSPLTPTAPASQNIQTGQPDGYPNGYLDGYLDGIGSDAERVQLALAAGAIIGTWFWHLPSDCFTIDEQFAVSFGMPPQGPRHGLPLQQVIETVHPDDRPGLIEAINAAIARGGAYAYQYRVRRADGHYHWIEANGRVELDEHGKPWRFPGVLLDIGHRRAIEAERDRATAMLRALTDSLEQRVSEAIAEREQVEADLRQAQKMEAVGQLTGGLAHDFNNLLAGISGSLELLRIRLRQGRVDELPRYIDTAQDATRRAASLTHRLLAFSRRQTLDPKPTDVNRLVQGLEELINRSVGPQIEVAYQPEAGLWPALVDPNQLETALLNLCINARDAMPGGGTLRITGSNLSLEAGPALDIGVAPGHYLALSVADTGTGMPPEVVCRAFDPFYTTKPMGQGTGLGLSMVYGFVRQSGGQVRIQSQVGQGTTMTLYLPRHAGAVDAGTGALCSLAAPPIEGLCRVLLVDDEPAVRAVLAESLADAGFSVAQAGDGAAGLAVLQSPLPLDLLITDVGLPGGMNGRQLADAGRVLRPGLRTLFITGYAEQAVMAAGGLEEGMALMTKPFELHQLAERARQMVEGL
ncbi:PAS domain-containing hybrid sensor histidine kinase/response regulator [Pseudomonas sp. KNUC1026]|uniref:PAS domain-containing hybrid sensor histidine kinase/response regulator n=1 Tax=Pseudomonas sp. KNUC1026 TaxID=2893890 RepID=UPI002E365593|nr:ATP-binding protein [Pseudomonas sp. KNUC1026]